MLRRPSTKSRASTRTGPASRAGAALRRRRPSPRGTRATACGAPPETAPSPPCGSAGGRRDRPVARRRPCLAALRGGRPLPAPLLGARRRLFDEVDRRGVVGGRRGFRYVASAGHQGSASIWSRAFRASPRGSGSTAIRLTTSPRPATPASTPGAAGRCGSSSSRSRPSCRGRRPSCPGAAFASRRTRFSSVPIAHADPAGPPRRALMMYSVEPTRSAAVDDLVLALGVDEHLHAGHSLADVVARSRPVNRPCTEQCPATGSSWRRAAAAPSGRRSACAGRRRRSRLGEARARGPRCCGRGAGRAGTAPLAAPSAPKAQSSARLALDEVQIVPPCRPVKRLDRRAEEFM